MCVLGGCGWVWVWVCAIGSCPPFVQNRQERKGKEVPIHCFLIISLPTGRNDTPTGGARLHSQSCIPGVSTLHIIMFISVCHMT